MTGTDAHYHRPPVYGQATATGIVSLVGVSNTDWLPVPGAQITLPAAGTYEIWADVHGGIVASDPPVDESLTGRIYDVTAGAEIPETLTPIVTLTHPEPVSTDWGVATQATAAIRWIIQVTGPTVLRLEAAHNVGPNSNGAGPGAGASGVGGDFRGQTRIGFVRLGS